MKAGRSAVLAALLAVPSAAEQTATVWLPQLNIGDVKLNANSGAVLQADGATTTLVLSDPSGLQYTATYVSKTILTLDLHAVDSKAMTTSIAAECTRGSPSGSADCSGEFRQIQEPRTHAGGIDGGSQSSSDFSGNRPVHDAVVTITQGSLPTESNTPSASPGAGGSVSSTLNNVFNSIFIGGGTSTAAAPSTTGAPNAANSSKPPSTTSTSTSKGGAAPLGNTNMLSGGAAVVAGWLALLL